MLYKHSVALCVLSFHSLTSVYQREEPMNFDKGQSKAFLSTLSSALGTRRFFGLVGTGTLHSPM